MGRSPQLVGGLVPLVLPFFVADVLWMLVGAAGITALIWLAARG
jgi:hypothetical protein